jgi:hypothetical protein
MKQSRPFGVTLLALLVLSLAVLKLIRLALGLQSWEFLSELLPINLIYLVLSGLVWSVVGVILAAALWLGASWAPRFTRLAALVYTIYYWVEFVFLVEIGGRQQNWVYLLFVNVVLLVWIFGVLSRSRSKVYFGANNE